MRDNIFCTLVYSCRPEIKDIFLRSNDFPELYVKKEDKIMRQSRKLSASLQKFLIDKGFEFIYKENIKYYGKDKIFGIKVKIIKAMERCEIKEIMIKVSGSTMEEIRSKTHTIISGVKNIIDIMPAIRMYDKLEVC